MKKAEIIKNGNLNLKNITIEADTSIVVSVNQTTLFDEKWALEQAVKAAKNSTCKSQRGIVIWNRKHGLMTSGWNALPKPFKCDSSEACRANCAKTAVHAEQAAILAFDYINISIKDCEMIHVKIVEGKAVVSEKPSCWQCSKLILQAGLKSMWLYQKEGFVEYSAEEFHRQTLINCGLV
jgi:deoxycytidylate deaminase